MKILVIGASGTIGKAVVASLSARHEIIQATRTHTPLAVDIADKASIARLYDGLGKLDAVVCVGGSARSRPLLELSDEDFQFSFGNKLMGQLNLMRLGLDKLSDGGSFTFTTGIFSRKPVVKTAAIALVNGGIEAFVRAAALELPRGIRINAVSPGWVRESLVARGADATHSIPAAKVAARYVEAIEGKMSGETLAADE